MERIDVFPVNVLPPARKEVPPPNSDPSSISFPCLQDPHPLREHVTFLW